MKTVNKIAAWIDKFGELWSILIIALFTLPFIEAVFCRWLLNQPTSWSQELCCMLFGVWFIVGGAHCEAKNGHISMDLFYEKLHGVLKIVVDSIIFLIVSIVLLYLLKEGVKDSIYVIQNHIRTSSFWNPVAWPYRIFIPLGILLYYIRFIISYLQKLQLAASQIKRK
ncbi:MAG: TRAP transporter small permease subunit [Oscillospiraceae bacterium]|nr:TRAP transporter small permease subunit [Oscillospiraceae bacterium]